MSGPEQDIVHPVYTRVSAHDGLCYMDGRVTNGKAATRLDATATTAAVIAPLQL